MLDTGQQQVNKSDEQTLFAIGNASGCIGAKDGTVSTTTTAPAQ